MKPNYLFSLLVALFTVSILKSAHASKIQRIVGGSDVSVGYVPYAAAIHVTTQTSKIFCGGTLVGDQCVLTAAQCVHNAVSFTVQLGSTKLNGADPVKVTVATSEYFIHPNYDPLTLDSDIGIIKLRMPVEFSSYLRSLHSLPLAEMEEGRGCQTVGWGQLNDKDDELSENLQVLALTSLSQQECRLTYGNAITDNMMCVAGSYNQGTCIGDTGSPLVSVYKYGAETLYGIASFVSGNGCEGFDPSGFTRVYPFVDWIVNITGYNRFS